MAFIPKGKIRKWVQERKSGVHTQRKDKKMGIGEEKLSQYPKED